MAPTDIPLDDKIMDAMARNVGAICAISDFGEKLVYKMRVVPQGRIKKTFCRVDLVWWRDFVAVSLDTKMTTVTNDDIEVQATVWKLYANSPVFSKWTNAISWDYVGGGRAAIWFGQGGDEGHEPTMSPAQQHGLRVRASAPSDENTVDTTPTSQTVEDEAAPTGQPVEDKAAHGGQTLDDLLACYARTREQYTALVVKIAKGAEGLDKDAMELRKLETHLASAICAAHRSHIMPGVGRPCNFCNGV